MMGTALLKLLLVCMVAAAHAEQFDAKVIAVLDGDTVMVTRVSGPPVKVRLAEIDAPEVGHAGMGGKSTNSQKAQPGGIAAKQSLSEMVLHKQVSMDVQAVDSYGRLIAHLTVDGMNINEQQVRRGMAWEYSHYHGNKAYIALQSEAQQARRGLWSQASPLPPWQWRKSHVAAAPSKPGHAKPPGRVAEEYTCGSKRRCSQMRACDEAHYYLTRCGVKSLDPNRDGVPCEKLCGGRN